MGRTIIRDAFILTGIYLALAYATGAGKLLSSAGTAAVSLEKTFQGR